MKTKPFDTELCLDYFRRLLAGHDVRHAAIGPGTANSHGYERTHVDGLKNTYDLLTAYLLRG